jgi:hypothetical protein
MDEVDNINQYGRWNCLLVHGATEAPEENTDDTVIDIFKSKLNMDITKQDLDRSHRLRSRKQNFNRPKATQFNARNLSQNFEKITDFLTSLNFPFTIIGVTETWLTNSTDVSYYNLENYNVLTCNRIDRQGGGVIIFILIN